MRWLVAVALLGACGRIGFDDHASDASTTAPDAFEPTKVALGAGGDARAIALAGPTLDVWYAVIGDNHIVRTDDAGLTFHDCGFLPRGVTWIEADAMGRVVTATTKGVWESTDSCATFNQLGSLGYITTVALDSAAILASDANGLEKWDGSSWTLVPTPFDGTFLDVISVGNPYVIGSDAGVAISPNGVTYTVKNAGLASLQVLRVARAGTKLYLGTGGGVHVSTDGGSNWVQLTNTFGDATAIDPGDPMFIAHASTVGLEISIDAGNSWSPDLRPTDFDHSRVQDLAFDPAGSGKLIAATGRGLFQSDAHNMPFHALGSFDAWSVNAIAPDSTGTARYIGTTVGVVDIVTHDVRDSGGPDFTSSNDVHAVGSTLYSAGRTLSRSTGGAFVDLYGPVAADSYWMTCVREDAGTLFATSYERLLRSNDNGMTWTPSATGFTFTFALLVVPGAPRNVYVCGAQGLAYSSDDGATFSRASTEGCSALLQLADGSILSGTDKGLYRAPNVGGAFTRITSTTPVFRALALRGSTIFAVIDDTVQSSTDGGTTFTPVTGFTGHSPFSLWVDPDGSLVVGTLGWGAYRFVP